VKLVQVLLLLAVLTSVLLSVSRVVCELFLSGLSGSQTCSVSLLGSVLMPTVPVVSDLVVLLRSVLLHPTQSDREPCRSDACQQFVPG
jgi:hypothetical protein